MLKPSFQQSALDSPTDFQCALMKWFGEGEDYPWRRTTDPYAILVSEVMLQQTTIHAVIENRRFELFMEQFPTLQDLANASEEEILRAWEGLGYYNRVRNLQKTAQEVVEYHGGIFPTTLEELQALPGVGAYTAAAVASFAYDIGAPLVDANVARVFARLFDDDTAIDSTTGQKMTWSLAKDLVPATGRVYNSALMELGQRVCKSREVLCIECPITQFCKTQRPLELPAKKPKKKATEVMEHALWIQRENGSLYLQQGQGSRRKGMWTLPLVELDEVKGRSLINESKYTITRYKVTLKVYEADESEAENYEGQWFTLAELENVPMPSPLRRVIEMILLG